MSQDRKEKAEAWAKKANRIMKKAPKDVWLYSGSGTMFVMLKNEHGEQAMTPDGGCDQDYIVTELDIENDGGDF